MYELKIETRFSSAHNLRGYQGVCESLHGHNWRVEIFVKSSELNDIGLVIDFRELKSFTKEVVDKLDHKYLNEIDHFKQINPSSENIAKYIYSELEGKLKAHNVILTKVTVYESLNSSASYFKKE
jgi:6-pyruvoyltetrahydropterin/6-carboxytetrahydropterin synthase